MSTFSRLLNTFSCIFDSDSELFHKKKKKIMCAKGSRKMEINLKKKYFKYIVLEYRYVRYNIKHHNYFASYTVLHKSYHI